jgi:uncharacterized protein YbdZ (MbtH family)
MNQNNQQDPRIYKVIQNHRGEFAIWQIERKVPFSWRDTNKSGMREECLAYIARKHYQLLSVYKITELVDGTNSNQIYDGSQIL